MNKPRRYPKLQYLNLAIVGSDIGSDGLNLKAHRLYNDEELTKKYPYMVEIGCFSIQLDDEDVAALRLLFTELPKLP